MTAISLPQAPKQSATPAHPVVALVGNPNAGKTSLFNRLTGLRTKTANFPGTTVEHRISRAKLASGPVELVDLPGLYSLDATTPDERVAGDVLRGDLPGVPSIDAVVLVIDATQLQRNLYLASRVIDLQRPTLVALNMTDVAEARGIRCDIARLKAELGCRVVPIVARSGKGLAALRDALNDLVSINPTVATPACNVCATGCPFAARFSWAEEVCDRCGVGDAEHRSALTERIDAVLTHPLVGVVSFFGVMAVMFVLIFYVADTPMGWIETGVAALGEAFAAALPAGDLSSLLVDGVIGGVGGVLVFLPQICVLFFFITLLEDSGYMARGVFAMDRLMGRVGLPGRAFVPMLSAHACAIPGIMATKVIENPRDRLITILVLPFMTCSARLPVYLMIAWLLFPGDPASKGLLFAGGYGLGILAALTCAFALRKTILPGKAAPLVIELPCYRLPSLRNALVATWDRALVFLRKAGTIILLISMVLWAASTYPKLPEDRTDAASQLTPAQQQLQYTVAGRLGRFVEPVFDPLGFNWQINVGVISSFAAREVIVSTLAITYGLGEEVADDTRTLSETLRTATNPDGTAAITTATALSLLVFFVLAMQCLPTQAVTAREAGSWKWAAFQLAFMSAAAWLAACATYQLATVVLA